MEEESVFLYDLFGTPFRQMSPEPAPKSSNAGNFLASDMFWSRVTEDGLLQLMITRVRRLCETASQASFRASGVQATPCIPKGAGYILFTDLGYNKTRNT
jgi:hypothetical protein